MIWSPNNRGLFPDEPGPEELEELRVQVAIQADLLDEALHAIAQLATRLKLHSKVSTMLSSRCTLLEKRLLALAEALREERDQ